MPNQITITITLCQDCHAQNCGFRSRWGGIPDECHILRRQRKSTAKRDTCSNYESDSKVWYYPGDDDEDGFTPRKG